VTKLDKEGAAALAAAARAFARAQKKGYVWIGDQGTFETYENTLAFVPPPPIHPDQLRFA
jgi:hypothetical protein